ncbi:helix-turn-helix transcriptional regulator [Tianweitania sp. BSSL-BM11]|uniref:Helix-turn-helix transcriptional regulator n=2 Tax=Tianweitania aestuarii TaxID=2814886 RepID=A0ABS5RWL5_9HYPH|nr:TetR/AcrR family transcriptional regulator [Tianweitania aestuarii]MBS9721421.1 helix-turn-helix transcriptional regulator [Tianweitania aestuarii]
MRADAKKNYEGLLAVAREVIAEQGVDASLRDIARRADVGLATLYRHFPTREALLEALLQKALSDLIARSEILYRSDLPAVALTTWFIEATTFVHVFKGIVDLMAEALADPGSALHEDCKNLRAAGTKLLRSAQQAGVARKDVDGDDLFALIGAAGWIGDQPAFEDRADRLASFIANALMCPPQEGDSAGSS